MFLIRRSKQNKFINTLNYLLRLYSIKKKKLMLINIKNSYFLHYNKIKVKNLILIKIPLKGWSYKLNGGLVYTFCSRNNTKSAHNYTV